MSCHLLTKPELTAKESMAQPVSQPAVYANVLCEMFQAEVQKIKTHILCSVTFSENRAVYEIMWESIVERGWPQMTIWRMRVACWISKATNTQTHNM
jgi:hypothetical protein